ncbi:MAG: phage tail sheath family protein [Caldilineaceae bacterium]|nr:phage tail sheath family protein [Caldilineaceae bacterium]
MQPYLTPGVHIKHIVTEPARVLRTGVPLFVGFVRKEYLDLYNAQQAEPEEQYIVDSQRTSFITRKRAYQALPQRPYTAAQRSLPTDPTSQSSGFYMTSTGKSNDDDRARVRQSYGARGQANVGTQETAPEQILSEKPQRFTVWPQFQATYGALQAYGFLSYAVRGFFENGGRLCYVQMIGYNDDSPLNAVQDVLQKLEPDDEFDLVCLPDIFWSPTDQPNNDWSTQLDMQNALLRHCDQMGDRFALLDGLPRADDEAIKSQRAQLSGDNGALYHPWVRVVDGPLGGLVPPCGHVAGVIARTDLSIGVHRAPANQDLLGVVDLAVNLDDERQGPLNEVHVNCLRAFPRRGIRVWGARTLSPSPLWTYINVRRIFLTAGRWIERNMTNVVFEPNNPELWGEIVRDLTVYFTQLLEQGALAGRGSGEAFYVKCDAETNPPALREQGIVVTEIGLAATVPAEFIVVRIIHGPAGVRIETG